MNNPYNTDEMISLIEKFCSDFKEFKDRFYTFKDYSDKYDRVYDTVHDTNEFILHMIRLLKSRGYKFKIDLEPSLFS